MKTALMLLGLAAAAAFSLFLAWFILWPIVSTAAIWRRRRVGSR